VPKLLDDAKMLPKSSMLWVRRTNITDDSQTDGSCHKANVTYRCFTKSSSVAEKPRDPPCYWQFTKLFTIVRNKKWHALEICVRGQSPCEFICTSLKSTVPGLSFCRWHYVYILFYTANAGNKEGGALLSFKVIRGHRNWYQSKAGMQFLISLLL